MNPQTFFLCSGKAWFCKDCRNHLPPDHGVRQLCAAVCERDEPGAVGAPSSGPHQIQPRTCYQGTRPISCYSHLALFLSLSLSLLSVDAILLFPLLVSLSVCLNPTLSVLFCWQFALVYYWAKMNHRITRSAWKPLTYFQGWGRHI